MLKHTDDKWSTKTDINGHAGPGVTLSPKEKAEKRSEYQGDTIQAAWGPANPQETTYFTCCGNWDWTGWNTVKKLARMICIFCFCCGVKHAGVCWVNMITGHSLNWVIVWLLLQLRWEKSLDCNSTSIQFNFILIVSMTIQIVVWILKTATVKTLRDQERPFELHAAGTDV